MRSLIVALSLCATVLTACNDAELRDLATMLSNGDMSFTKALALLGSSSAAQEMGEAKVAYPCVLVLLWLVPLVIE